jgi:hypothetical protein
MGSLRVVVGGVHGKHLTQVSLAEDQHPIIRELGPHGQHEAFGETVRPRTPRRDLDHLDARVRQDRVERCRELTGPIADEEPKPSGTFAEVHDKVAGLLRRPRPVGMPGHVQNVQVSVADLECEQDVEPPQGERAVDVEEVDREHAAGLRAQELPPAGVGVSQRRRWDAVALKDPPDCRGADAVAELEQLALDPRVPPARVLPRHPHYQGGEAVLDRWPSGPVGVGPSSADEAAMPAQDRVGGDQTLTTQRSGQPPDERGEDRPVRPIHARSRAGAAQHSDLMAQHEELDVLGGGRADRQQDQPEHLPEDQVQQPQRHVGIMPTRRSPLVSDPAPSSGTSHAGR